jgi:flagellar motor switch protein FliN/FliY
MSQDTRDQATPIEKALDSAVESILVQTKQLEALEASKPAGDPLGLKGLRDVPLPVSIELGRARVPLGELMSLAPGSLVPLERAAHEPVDVYVGGKLYARGEVVTIGAKYGIRVTSLVTE